MVGNGELFGRLATRAMLPRMTEAVAAWHPDLVLREPCEHASTIAATRAGVPVAQVAISTAEAEWGAIGVAASALADLGPDVEHTMRAMPYLTSFRQRSTVHRFRRRSAFTRRGGRKRHSQTGGMGRRHRSST